MTKHAFSPDDFCRDRGLRFTSSRRAVLALLKKAGKPMKAYQLLEEMGSDKPPAVYRALDFLTGHGLAHKIAPLNAYTACAHPGRHDVCCMLICTSCGKADEICGDTVRRAVADAAREKGYALSEAVCDISGVCPDCAATAQP